MSYRIGYTVVPFGFELRLWPYIIPDDPAKPAANERAKAAREYAAQQAWKQQPSALQGFASVAGKDRCPCCGRDR